MSTIITTQNMGGDFGYYTKTFYPSDGWSLKEPFELYTYVIDGEIYMKTYSNGIRQESHVFVYKLVNGNWSKVTSCSSEGLGSTQTKTTRLSTGCYKIRMGKLEQGYSYDSDYEIIKLWRTKYAPRVKGSELKLINPTYSGYLKHEEILQSHIDKGRVCTQ